MCLARIMQTLLQKCDLRKWKMFVCKRLFRKWLSNTNRLVSGTALCCSWHCMAAGIALQLGLHDSWYGFAWTKDWSFKLSSASVKSHQKVMEKRVRTWMNAKRIPMIVKHQQFATIWMEHMSVSVRAVIADITRVVFKVSLGSRLLIPGWSQGMSH